MRKWEKHCVKGSERGRHGQIMEDRYLGFSPESNFKPEAGRIRVVLLIIALAAE